MTLDTNPILRTAHDFWRGLPQPAGLPDIRRLEAATIPRNVLPHLIVAEIIGADFNLSRLRLAGSEVTRWFRELPEGLDAVGYGRLTDPAYLQHLRDLLSELIQHRRPIFCRSTYTLPGLTTGDPPNVVTCDRLALPMADGGDDVGCVMLAATLTASDFRAGPLRILPPEPGTEVRHGPFSLPD
jgi:hypothetical protein